MYKYHKYLNNNNTNKEARNGTHQIKQPHPQPSILELYFCMFNPPVKD